MSDYLENANIDLSRETADIKVIGNSYTDRVVGLRDVSVSLGGVFDSTHDANVWDAVGDGSTGGDEAVWALCPQGDTLGYYCYCGKALANSFSVNAGATDAVKYPVGAINSDNADRCQVLHALGAETSDDSESSLDGSASSSAGGRGYIVASAVSGTVDVTIEHSTNDSDWTTLLTFTQLTAAGDETQSLTASADVYRYVRATWDVSVAGSATFFVAFNRN
jgi:hypothetical protein